MSGQSLHQSFTGKNYIPILLSLAFLFLVLGLFLPAIHLKELIFFHSTFSVITGISSMFSEGHYILASVIILFSIVFPLFKLFVLNFIWFFRMEDNKRDRFLHWLGLLGKWSMLDVFVVAVMIVITKISKFADAEPKIGIYLFCASIIITMFSTEKIVKLTENLQKSHLNTSPAS